MILSDKLFCYLGGPTLKQPFTWGKVDMTAMARCLLVLCKQIYTIFIKETRLLHISSACYIRTMKFEDFDLIYFYCCFQWAIYMEIFVI